MKNYINKIFFVLILLPLLSGCKEEEIEVTPLSSLVVSNVIIDGKVARLNNYLRDSTQVMNYSFYTLKAGKSQPIKCYASITPNAPYFSENKDIENGGLYSIFLGGTHTAPEAVWVKDDIQPYPDQDVIRVRIVNMSPNSVPISLTMGNSTNVNVFSGIVYKQVTPFSTLPFPATLPTGGNVFQIRNASGSILASYTMPASGTISQRFSRRRNVTLVFKGMAGATGTNALGILPVANYTN